MVDRQDIDALLVGALYGELTPADEARLAAHLESHPGDRNSTRLHLPDARRCERSTARNRNYVLDCGSLHSVTREEGQRSSKLGSGELVICVCLAHARTGFVERTAPRLHPLFYVKRRSGSPTS